MFNRKHSDPEFFADLITELERLQHGFAEIARKAPEIRVERVSRQGTRRLETRVRGSTNRAMLSRFNALAWSAGRVVFIWNPTGLRGETLVFASSDDLFLAGLFDLPLHRDAPIAEGATRIEVIENAPDVAVAALELLLDEAVRAEAADRDDRAAKPARGPKQEASTLAPTLPTIPVSLGYAAKRWFRCSKNTLKAEIATGVRRARQLSERRWIFDLDEVEEANPNAKKGADPYGRRTRKGGRRKS